VSSRAEEQSVATFEVGDRYVARRRRLDSPALVGKMVGRSITRREIAAVLAANEIIEAFRHDTRVRYVLWGAVEGRPLHVVVAEDDILDATVVISVYEPDELHGWDPQNEFRARTEERR
jgi:hypothetical protein